MGASAEGAEMMMTLSAPSFQGASTFSKLVKTTVDSKTYLASASPDFMRMGYCSWSNGDGPYIDNRLPISQP